MTRQQTTIQQSEYIYFYIEPYLDSTGDGILWSYTVHFLFDEEFCFQDKRIVSADGFMTDIDAIEAGNKIVKAACGQRIGQLHQLIARYELIRASAELNPNLG